MDPLSDVLRSVRLSGAHFFKTTASGNWRVEAPEASGLTPRILPGSDMLISYHLVLSGQCWGGISGQEPVLLRKGDVILFTRGDAHFMSSGPDPGIRTYPIRSVPRFPQGVEFGDPDKPDVVLACGFFGCDRAPFNPLRDALPGQLVVQGLLDGVVGLFARQVEVESTERRAGSDSMLTRLAELMFIEVLRKYLVRLPINENGWLSGLRDPQLGRVLALIHGKPDHPWTLAALASEAATSRSGLAKRFAITLGMPPMQYLTRWRMQVAAGKLRGTNTKVATVAQEVGYQSEAAFSRAFKKATGHAPARWRVDH